MNELGNHRFVILKIVRKLLPFPRVATAGHSGQSAIITDTNLGDSGKADFLARAYRLTMAQSGDWLHGTRVPAANTMWCCIVRVSMFIYRSLIEHATHWTVA